MADPMYRQIADDLRNQIETGVLAPGSRRLPRSSFGRRTTPRATRSAMQSRC